METTDILGAKLSLREIEIIEDSLRREDEDTALNILRKKWKWLFEESPSYVDPHNVATALRRIADWIKDGAYKKDPPPKRPQRLKAEDRFWDFVCDYIAENTQETLFECESEEQANKLRDELVDSIGFDDIGSTVIKNKVNLFRIRSSPSRSNQSSPS